MPIRVPVGSAFAGIGPEFTGGEAPTDSGRVASVGHVLLSCIIAYPITA